MNKALYVIIALLTLILFGTTMPKTFEQFNETPSYSRINTYLLYSTCSSSYQGEYRVEKVGILGFVIDVSE